MKIADAILACLEHPGLRVVVVGDTYRDTVDEARREAFRAGVTWRSGTGGLLFPNGSSLTVTAARDGDVLRRLRGAEFHLALVSDRAEPGTCQFLETRLRAGHAGPPNLGLHPLT